MTATAPVRAGGRERGVLFSGEMVRAILAGRKTQTRRPVKPQPAPFVQATPDPHPPARPAPYIDSYCGERKTPANPRGMSSTWCWWTRDNRQGASIARCPFGVPGDRLWVRETFGLVVGAGHRIVFRADGAPTDRFSGEVIHGMTWFPSIHMPRSRSRITLEITNVRVQRLHEISEADCEAEGVDPWCSCVCHAETDVQTCEDCGPSHGLDGFRVLWDAIYGGTAGWDSNPWVWALTFRCVETTPTKVYGQRRG